MAKNGERFECVCVFFVSIILKTKRYFFEKRELPTAFGLGG